MSESTQIEPANYLIVRLELTKGPGGDSYPAVLAASRRCLADFTADFPSTGYKLLRADDAEELEACMLKAFRGLYDLATSLIILPAPVRNDWSEYYYEDAEFALIEELAEELESLAERVTSTRVTARTWEKAVRLCYRVKHHFTTPEVERVQVAIDKLRYADIDNRRRKVSRYLASLVLDLRGDEENEV